MKRRGEEKEGGEGERREKEKRMKGGREEMGQGERKWDRERKGERGGIGRVAYHQYPLLLQKH